MPRTSLFLFAASLVAGCGPSESLTDPDPDVPDVPDVPGDPSTPRPPAALPLRTDLGTFGGASSRAHDINDGGVVVGEAQTAAGTLQGFLWTVEGGLQPLPPLPGDRASSAIAVANDTTVLGVSVSDAGTARPVTWTATGAISELPIPPIAGARLTPADRNGAGTVVGDAGFTDAPDALSHAWVWNPGGGLTDLADQLEVPFENSAAAVNEAGTVVGTMGGGLWRAYVWQPQGGARYLGVPGTAPERTEVTALDVGQDGRVVGWTSLFPSEDATIVTEPFPTFGSHAYVWSEASGFTLLPGFDGQSQSDAVGYDLNDRDDVVGSAAEPATNVIVAVAWLRGGAIVRLNGAEVNPSVALAVNSTGIAAGWTSTGPEDQSPNRATVWNIDKATPMTARIRGRPGEPGRAARPQASPRGAASCLQLRPPSKMRLIECVERRTR